MKTIKIFGSPGTGKTTYLLNLLEKLLQVYNPHEIAFVSFTKKGSYEGKERAIKKFGFSESDTSYFRTLHSLAFQSLNLKSSSIIDKHDFKDLSKSLGMNFLGFYTEELKHNDDAYLFYDQLQRNNRKISEKMLLNLELDKIKTVQYNYNNFKKKLNLKDFTDIIEEFVKKEIVIPVKIAIVDEAQDLTTLQWKMIMQAFRNVDFLYIAGDDDQAIYEWSGADVDYFINLKCDELVILEKSFRLPDNIFEFSKKLTNKIKNRVEKKNVKGNGKIGTIKFINNFDEVIINNEQTYLFLSRNNFFLKSIQKYFMDKGMVFNYKNECSIKGFNFDIIMEFCRVKKHQSNVVSSLLKSNLKKDYDMTKEWYDNLNWNIDEINYYRDLIKNDVHKNLNKKVNIDINTIHTVKGGEADNVVVMQDLTASVYNNLKQNPDSENRIFYVAVTRAKQNLYLMQANSKNSFEFN
jgi:superfamily I DNA/RNA helicase